MNCEQAKARLSDFTAGFLEGLARQQVEAHLVDCAACQEAAERLRRLDALMRGEALQSDQALVSSVMAGVSARRRASVPGWVDALDDIGPLALVVLAVPALLWVSLREAGTLAPLWVQHAGASTLSAHPIAIALIVAGVGLVAGLLSWVANRVSEALA